MFTPAQVANIFRVVVSSNAVRIEFTEQHPERPDSQSLPVAIILDKATAKELADVIASLLKVH